MFPLKSLRFEDVNVYVPNKYQKISKTMWGDYPPPMPAAEKRFPHEGNIVCGNTTQKMIEKYDLGSKIRGRGVITEYGKDYRLEKMR